MSDHLPTSPPPPELVAATDRAQAFLDDITTQLAHTPAPHVATVMLLEHAHAIRRHDDIYAALVLAAAQDLAHKWMAAVQAEASG